MDAERRHWVENGRRVFVSRANTKIQLISTHEASAFRRRRSLFDELGSRLRGNDEGRMLQRTRVTWPILRPGRASPLL